MIDYLALSIGHGLLAIGFWRLALRDGLNVDPLLGGFKRREAERRKARQSTAPSAAASKTSSKAPQDAARDQTA